MAITINPNRINHSPKTAGKAGDRQQREQEPLVVPSKAQVNYIPSTESLKTLILSAVAALRQGVYWDRGTILNLVV